MYEYRSLPDAISTTFEFLQGNYDIEKIMFLAPGVMGQVGPRPSTLDPQPSTLDPRPSTLDPRPSTLHRNSIPLVLKS